MKCVRPPLLVLAGVCVVACKTTDTGAPEPRGGVDVTPLPADAQLVRVSMALRGTRPSLADLDRVASDPDAVSALAAEYAASEEFAQTTKDLFAEVLRMRSVELTLPASVGRDGEDEIVLGTQKEMRDALAEEPLDLIAEVVRQDLPFSEIVTADWTVLDDVSAQVWDGHDHDADVGGLQVVRFTDGRPAAGILSTGGFLLRHDSNGRNYNRGRSSVLSEALLCDSYADRDIPIEGDLSDPDAVADAVMNDPACVACHQSVDPIASNFIPFRPTVSPNNINNAYASGCPDEFSSCYPLPMYFPEYTGFWEDAGLRPPGYFGASVDDLGGVGEGIAEDARFSRCMAQRFAAYLTQRSLSEVSAEEVARLQTVFIDSDLSARDLAVAVVTDPAFLASSVSTADGEEPTELQIIRPEQLDRMIEDLTGLRLAVELSPTSGETPLLMDDLIGFRAMSGGIDGDTVALPTHLPTPTRLLTLAMVAEEASGHVVSTDLEASQDQRVLLLGADGNTTSEGEIRTELVHLHRRLFGRVVDPDGPEIDDVYALWKVVADDDGAEAAWEVVVAALLQSPDILFY